MATPIITSKSVRIFMMDKPEMNSLLSGLRWDEDDLSEAIINCIDYYNTSLPPTPQYTVETFPYRVVLLTGVAGWLLKSSAINQASNNLNYESDGVTVNDNDKAQIFAQMGSEFYKDFKEMCQNIKVAQNIAGAYGHKLSEYYYTQQFGVV